MERLEYTKNEYAEQKILAHYNRIPAAYVRSFGCQQSVNDGERIKGVLQDIGFNIVDTPQEADVVLYNTCAVRENAELRVFGHIGSLKPIKQNKPGLIVGLCGCMAVQQTVVDQIRQKYPHVDIVLGTNAADTLPDVILEKLTGEKAPVKLPDIRDDVVVEQVPQYRDSKFKAFLPIMFGCDNFCSYCIVPYLRGRERSRKSIDVLEEFSSLVQNGYSDITLLGQNVNSYGKKLDEDIDFSGLLQLLCQVPGEYKLRFMTSHPKDATKKLIDTIVSNEHLCKHLHLPVQSGSNRILKQMNRGYTIESYLELINYAKNVCPDMTFSSDIIVGYPGETEEDFEQTMEMVKQVGYVQLFTFIYSKRTGTKAADLPDPVTREQKVQRLERLLKLQEEMVVKVTAPMIGKVYTGLVEGKGKQKNKQVARIDNNMIVEFDDSGFKEGSLAQLKITGLKGAILTGEPFNINNK